MKKTISMIYRFVFILFSVWGICQKIGYNILTFSPRILNFAIYIDFLSLICVLTVFVISVTRMHGRILRCIKSILTLLSAVILFKNINFGMGINNEWILSVFLPAMMCIDWVLFEKKGTFNFADPLIWLIGALFTGMCINFLVHNIFGINDYLYVLGLYETKDKFVNLLIAGIIISFIMYIIDCVIYAFSKGKAENAAALIYRVLFIVLECYAFFTVTNGNLPDLIYNMKYFHMLSNFLCTVYIAVVIIYNLIKFKSLKKNTVLCPRIKGAFTVYMILTMLAQIFWGAPNFYLSPAQIIIYFAAPIMILFDWVIFDNRGYYRFYDPLIWLIFPVVYVLFSYPSVMSSVYEILKGRTFYEVLPYTALAAVGTGYIIYIFDKIFSRR